MISYHDKDLINNFLWHKHTSTCSQPLVISFGTDFVHQIPTNNSTICSSIQMFSGKFHFIVDDNPFKTYRMTMFKMQKICENRYMTRKSTVCVEWGHIYWLAVNHCSIQWLVRVHHANVCIYCWLHLFCDIIISCLICIKFQWKIKTNIIHTRVKIYRISVNLL